MDIEINVGSCSQCKGVDACNKYCVMHAGKALVDFISRVDMIETKIGEYRSREKDGPLDLVVHGHQLYDLNTPSWLLTDISTTLDATSKFETVFGKNPIQLINNYGAKNGLKTEEIKEVTDKINKLNKNKLIILPFKPHTPCSIDVETDSIKQKKRDSKIVYIKWVTNKQTYKLNCEIAFEFESDTNKKIYKLPITDYINKFRLSSLEMQAKSTGHDSSLIKITDHGMIKPIAIKDGNNIVAIDGTYVYSTINGDTRILGYWDKMDNLVMNVETKSPAYKKIQDNINYIKNHKKYIAPYLLYEANVIEL